MLKHGRDRWTVGSNSNLTPGPESMIPGLRDLTATPFYLFGHEWACGVSKDRPQRGIEGFSHVERRSKIEGREASTAILDVPRRCQSLDPCNISDVETNRGFQRYVTLTRVFQICTPERIGMSEFSSYYHSCLFLQIHEDANTHVSLCKEDAVPVPADPQLDPVDVSTRFCPTEAVDLSFTFGNPIPFAGLRTGFAGIRDALTWSSLEVWDCKGAPLTVQRFVV